VLLISLEDVAVDPSRRRQDSMTVLKDYRQIGLHLLRAVPFQQNLCDLTSCPADS
jgi:hypothetical protein